MEFKKLTSALSFIARIKEGLPFTMRGWVAVLGLHVQGRHAGRLTRLQAGGKFISYFDAWEEDGEYKIRKFDQVTWDKRFARLVEPTIEITLFLAHQEGEELAQAALRCLSNAAKVFNQTGEWPGLPGILSDDGREDLSPEDELARIIAHQEKLKVENPLFGIERILADNYCRAGRFKDAERILLSDIDKNPSKSELSRTDLVMLYLSALSYSVRGIGTPARFGDFYDITPESLEFDNEALRDMIQNEIVSISEYALHSDVLKLASIAAEELSAESFEAFEKLVKEKSSRD